MKQQSTSTRVIECCGQRRIPLYSCSLKLFPFMNVKKVWSALGDKLNQFMPLIITFGEHKAVNVHVQFIYISRFLPNNSPFYIGPQSILAKHYSSNILISIKLVIWIPRRLP